MPGNSTLQVYSLTPLLSGMNQKLDIRTPTFLEVRATSVWRKAVCISESSIHCDPDLDRSDMVMRSLCESRGSYSWLHGNPAGRPIRPERWASDGAIQSLSALRALNASLLEKQQVLVKKKKKAPGLSTPHTASQFLIRHLGKPRAAWKHTGASRGGGR